MTAREIDMLKEFLSRELHHVTTELARLRQESADDRSLVRADLRTLASRVDALEDHEAIEESRRLFREELLETVTRRVSLCTGAVVGIGGLLFAVLQQFVL